MFSWLTANLGTILIVLVLSLIVIGIIVKLQKDKKKGVSSCCGNCGVCPMGCTCRAKK